METGVSRYSKTGDPPAGVPGVPLLQGVAGFRDLGGFPTVDGVSTKRGVLFRSPCPSELTARDREVLAELGVAVRIDLRASFELREAPSVDLAELACAHIPVLDAPDPARYVRRLRAQLGDRRDAGAVLEAFLRTEGPAFAQIFELLGSSTPAVVHCTTGRDRTGLVAGLALRLAGVADNFIAIDYAESRPEGLAGDGEPILHALTLVDAEYGSARGYLVAHGCPDEAIDAFRAAFRTA